MLDAYVEQALALLEAGIDILRVETCQDLLQAKIGAIAAWMPCKQPGSGFCFRFR